MIRCRKQEINMFTDEKNSCTWEEWQSRSQWIDIYNQEPDVGQQVIAAGIWFGEITGRGKDYIGLGRWNGECVSIASDTYGTDITEVTHWMPVPELPLVEGFK